VERPNRTHSSKKGKNQHGKFLGLGVGGLGGGGGGKRKEMNARRLRIAKR